MDQRAEIMKKEAGFTATFTRKLEQPKREVWQMLTDNEKLEQWFQELTFEQHGQNSFFLFDMGEGDSERLPVSAYEEERVLAFNWWEDHVRFDLLEENGATTLVLTETITRITDQTAKDLAGWHICLEAIADSLAGNKNEGMESWEYWLDEYKRLLQSMTVELE